jgi:superfamily I DNA and/or RNA helicase
VIIDEAGQMSLANALATSQVAQNLILLGDPQQLSQPTKAAHPPGTNASALSYVLGDLDTMPPEMGMFLPETRRMHPAVCGFISERFYEGRLGSHEPCGVQALEPFGVGLGLRLVDHDGRSSASVEEATAVEDIIGTLVGQTWTDQSGSRRVLELRDILVVTPYNAQVRTLARRLGPHAQVGTVDLFQGQEAPVVIYSMASSSADLAPRGMGFLYDLHRLNVAISRAQGVAVVVCNPALLRPSCHTPAQVRLASALCRYSETAAVFAE